MFNTQISSWLYREYRRRLLPDQEPWASTQDCVAARTGLNLTWGKLTARIGLPIQLPGDEQSREADRNFFYFHVKRDVLNAPPRRPSSLPVPAVAVYMASHARPRPRQRRPAHRPLPGRSPSLARTGLAAAARRTPRRLPQSITSPADLGIKPTVLTRCQLDRGGWHELRAVGQALRRWRWTMRATCSSPIPGPTPSAAWTAPERNGCAGSRRARSASCRRSPWPVTAKRSSSRTPALGKVLAFDPKGKLRFEITRELERPAGLGSRGTSSSSPTRSGIRWSSATCAANSSPNLAAGAAGRANSISPLILPRMPAAVSSSPTP